MSCSTECAYDSIVDLARGRLAQALDAKVEGGMYDALALCVYQTKEDDDFRSDDVKVITNWGEEEERRYER